MTKKPTACLFHRGLTFGGVEKWMQTLSSHLKRVRVKSIALEGVYFEPKVARQFEGIPIYTTEGSGEGVHRLGEPKSALHAACKGCDILIAAAGCPVLHNLVHGLEIPVVLVSHGTSKSMAEIVKGNLPGVDYLAAVCEGAKFCFPSDYHDKVAVLYNGLDASSMIPSTTSEEIKRRFKIPSHFKVLSQIARHGREKNPRAIIQALVGLPKDWIGISVGHGPLYDSLFEEAAAYVPGRLILAKEDTPVADVLKMSDACLLASHSEAWPFVMLEAWSMGVPFIMTEVPTVQELKVMFPDTTMVQTVPLNPSPLDLSEAISQSHNLNTFHINQHFETYFTAEVSCKKWDAHLLNILEDWKLPSSERHVVRVSQVPTFV